MIGTWIGSGSRRRKREGPRRRPAPRHGSGGIHHGADPLCLGCLGRTAPRLRPPGRDGPPIPLRSLPGPVPVGSGQDRRGVGLWTSGPDAASMRRSRRACCFRLPGTRLQAGGDVSCCRSRAAGRTASALRADPLELVALGNAVARASLRVASACWLTGGRERSSHFELALGEWSGRGLTRQAAGRGLDSLESAGLVSVTDRPGRSPIVVIQDASSSIS